jgi:hypothetical protein
MEPAVGNPGRNRYLPACVLTAENEENLMRVLFGIILGGILTVGGAYIYDSSHPLSAANTQASTERPLVNWDVVGTTWDRVAHRARAEWVRVAG